MSRFPADLHYAESHEWVRSEDGLLTVGITWFAQDSLGDVVHVELPKLGAHVSRGQGVAEIESVKAVSEIYSPVAGEIVEVNSELDGNEEVVNKDPYGGGWLFKVRADHGALAGLMNAAAYEKHVAEQDH